MAQLPTEQAIGPLPDSPPRRMGVGAWQPGDLARGAQDIARGGETLGLDLGMYAGQQQKLDDEASTAKANSQIAVNQVKTSQTLAGINDPSQVAPVREQFNNNVEDAVSGLRPDLAAKIRLEQAPHTARYQVGADDHQQGLVKNQALADFDSTSTGIINAAVATDDPGQRTNLLASLQQNGRALVSRGYMTPDEWAKKAPDVAHSYADAIARSETAKADAQAASGDYQGAIDRMKKIAGLYSFSPGEWNATPTGAGGAVIPGPVDPAHIARGTLAANQDEAYKAARGEGLSDTAARAVVANLSGESLATPQDNHMDGSHMSQGIASWDPTRVAAIKAQFGKEPKDMSVADQTRAHIWEINHNPAFAETKTALAGNDPKAMISSLVSNYERPANPDSDIENRTGFYKGIGARIGNGTTGGGSVPSGNIVAAGDSLGVGVAGAVQQDNTGNKYAQIGIPPLPNPKNPSAPNVLDKINALPTGAGKTLVLSTGASNASGLDPATYVPQQIAAAKAKGYDVVVLGVGPKFDALNPKLQQQATAAGAKFQPLDAGMIGPDGVHPIAQGYKAIAQQIGSAASGGGPAQGGATVQPSAFIGVPPPGAVGPNPHLAPPQSQWPTDARGVEQQPDGSFSYVMSEGNKVPVPGTRASGASGAPAPGNTGTLIDALRPQERAELGLQAQQKIDQYQKQAAAQDNQYTKAALQDMQSHVGLMVQGRPETDNMAAPLIAYAKSPIPEVRQAAATTMAIRNNLAAYHGASPAQVQADVEAKTAEYNAARDKFSNDPSAAPVLAAMGDILKASQDYYKTLSTEAVKQPIERAVKDGSLPNGVVPITQNSQDPEGMWSRRVSDAKTAAAALGVPVRYLQQSERPMMKQIAQQGGEPMVDMAMHIVKAAGSDAPAIFKEIGVDAPMFQKIGELAAGGGDPEAVRDIASIINAKQDKTARGDVPTFTDKMLSKFSDPLEATTARFGPDFTGRTRAAANMLMSAEAQRNGYDPKIDPTLSNWKQQDFDKAYDLATGATFAPDGTKYGGIADRNAKNWTGPSNKVIVPNSIKANDFGSVVNSITDADLKSLPSQPMGKNGSPISAKQIQGGQLEAIPDKDGIFRGKYAVFSDGVRDDNHLVRDAGGKPWALDLAQPQLDTALRARNPNSFLAKTPTAAPPAPDRYKATPGVIASTGGEGLTSAAETE